MQQLPTATTARLFLSPGIMRGALQRSEFVVHYQPTVRFKDARIDGLEALVRWRRPGFGLVSPAEFVPMAEENGFITELGAFVLRTACMQTRRWQRMYPGHTPLSVAVNVSPRQLGDPNLASLVRSVLEETSLDPHSLILEVTESLVVDEGSGALMQLEALKALGVRIAIDDFGTGYSSLSRLHRLPVSRLKIDQSFVARLMNSDQAGPLVTATIEMAHGLGMKTTAEGIETRDQWLFLRRHGCEEGQGYLLSRPVDATAIEALLNAKQALTRAGHGPGLHVLTGKVTTRTTAALIAASMASGWVGAAAAPGGAAVAQHFAASATASAVALSASLPFITHNAPAGPSAHAAVLGAHTAAPSGPAAKGAVKPAAKPTAKPAHTGVTSHGNSSSAGQNPNPAASQQPPGLATQSSADPGHQGDGQSAARAAAVATK